MKYQSLVIHLPYCCQFGPLEPRTRRPRGRGDARPRTAHGSPAVADDPRREVGQMTQVDMNAVKDKADIQKYVLGSMLSGGDSDPPDITARGWPRACDEYQVWALQDAAEDSLDLRHRRRARPQQRGRRGDLPAQHRPGRHAQPGAGRAGRAGHGPRDGRHGHPLGLRPVRRRVPGSRAGAAPTRASANRRNWWPTGRRRGARAPSSPCPNGRSVLACAKHFLGDGGTQDGEDQGNTCATRPRCGESTWRPIRRRQGRRGLDHGLLQQLERPEDARQQNTCSPTCSRANWASRASWSPTGRPSTSSRPTTRRDIERSINAGLDMVMIPNGPGQKNNYVEFITPAQGTGRRGQGAPGADRRRRAPDPAR